VEAVRDGDRNDAQRPERQEDADAKVAPVHVTQTKASPRAVVALFLLLSSPSAHAQSVTCGADADRIADALAGIRRSVDPCGESGQVLEVLEQFARCSAGRYQICTSTGIERNVFDRPTAASDELQRSTITWNPELRSELERGCDGDTAKPLQRDPAASLLHELVHAVQDCAGLNPGEHELEAVRIENIYRRAAGLCQRRGYGEEPLPPPMVRACTVGRCPCSVSVPVEPSIASPEPPPLAHASSAATQPERYAPERNGDRPE
jgi:hypothetical protein